MAPSVCITNYLLTLAAWDSLFPARIIATYCRNCFARRVDHYFWNCKARCVIHECCEILSRGWWAHLHPLSDWRDVSSILSSRSAFVGDRYDSSMGDKSVRRRLNSKTWITFDLASDAILDVQRDILTVKYRSNTYNPADLFLPASSAIYAFFSSSQIK